MAAKPSLYIMVSITVLIIACVISGAIGYFAKHVIAKAEEKEKFLVKAAQDASTHFIAEVRKLKDEVHQHIQMTEDNVSKVMQSVGMGLSQKVGDVKDLIEPKKSNPAE